MKKQKIHRWTTVTIKFEVTPDLLKFGMARVLSSGGKMTKKNITEEIKSFLYYNGMNNLESDLKHYDKEIREIEQIIEKNVLTVQVCDMVKNMKKTNAMISEAAAIMGKIGGSKKTEKKAKASATNGKLGGRPKGKKKKENK